MLQQIVSSGVNVHIKPRLQQRVKERRHRLDEELCVGRLHGEACQYLGFRGLRIRRICPPNQGDNHGSRGGHLCTLG
jgi:hypothetical protein